MIARLILAPPLGLSLCSIANAATELVMAIVHNGYMIEMQKHNKTVEAASPDIKQK